MFTAYFLRRNVDNLTVARVVRLREKIEHGFMPATRITRAALAGL